MAIGCAALKKTANESVWRHHVFHHSSVSRASLWHHDKHPTPSSLAQRSSAIMIESKPNGVARILVWGGATRLTPPDTFCVVSGSRPDSVGGGGVVAEIFRVPRHRTTVPYIFSLTTGADQSIYINCVNYGTFFYNYGQPQRNNIDSLQKKNI